MYLVFLFSLSVLFFSKSYSQLESKNNIFSFDNSSILFEKNETTNAILNDIGEAKIVGLTENAHHIEEPFVIRIELIKNLILNKNFRVLTLEQDWFLIEKINEIMDKKELNDCNKLEEAESYLAGMNRPVQYLNNLFPWICEFNKKNPNDKVYLTGSDFRSSTGEKYGSFSSSAWVPSTLHYSFSPLDKFNELIKINISPDSSLSSNCSEMKDYFPRENWFGPYIFSLKNLEKCLDAFIDYKTKLNLSNLNHEQIRNIYSLEQTIINTILRLKHYPDSVNDETQRDKTMFEITKLYHEHINPNKKTIVLFHNGHLMQNISISKQKAFSGLSNYSMGQHLKDYFKKEYYHIGMISSNNPDFTGEYNDLFLENLVSKSITTKYAYIPKNSNLMTSDLYFDGLHFHSKLPEDISKHFDINPSIFYDSLLYFRQSGKAKTNTILSQECIRSDSTIVTNNEMLSTGYACRKFGFKISDQLKSVSQISYTDYFGFVWSDIINTKYLNNSTETVSYEEAVNFCKRNSLSLPSVADFFRLSQFFGAEYYKKNKINTPLKNFDFYKYQIFSDQTSFSSVGTESYEWALSDEDNTFAVFNKKTGVINYVNKGIPFKLRFRCVTSPN